jgi:hypothetical protein
MISCTVPVSFRLLRFLLPRDLEDGNFLYTYYDSSFIYGMTSDIYVQSMHLSAVRLFTFLTSPLSPQLDYVRSKCVAFARL